MYKDRKETTHVKVGEKHTSIYKKYKYNVCQMITRPIYKINVSKKERKEKDTLSPHYIPQCTHSP